MESNIKTQVDFDIIIVGGGLVGAAFAFDLAYQSPGLNIAILEKHQFQFNQLGEYDDKIYAISPHNVDYLIKFGLWPNKERIGTINCMEVYSDNTSEIIFDYKLAHSAFLAKTVEYNNLQQSIYAKLIKQHNIFFLYDSFVDVVDCGSYIQAVCGTKTYKSRLIVGADGANSLVRQKALLDYTEIDYKQCGIVANFACELPHKNSASQWFLSNGDILAYLPLAADKQISIVWSTTNHVELLKQSMDEFRQQVAKSGQNKLGKLELLNQPVAFPLKLKTINKTYVNRLVLIGDAAHTIHPLAGQGVNLGFADSQHLANILRSVKSYQIGDTAVLAKYAASRLINVRKMQLTCHGLFQIFNLDIHALKLLRNNGVPLLNLLPGLKKYLIKQAINY